ncbi:conserved hypothetical protein [Cupriavidus phytorum]|uniref:Uncharacterized protein n=1 Tax=Cupriavidus taiwanensis TaxID=164546 RepID=A0A375B9H8_9BURK|nr:conserved hypothetical protein [Cupriavidus taiwanensis]
MGSRAEESKTIQRCVEAALGLASPVSRREANVFRLASMILRPRFPSESRRLWAICEEYFALHPSDLIESAQIVRNGWVVSVPRLRDSLELQLNRALQSR